MGSVIDLRTADHEALLNHISVGGQVGSPIYEAAKDMLQIRSLEATAKASQELAASTKELVRDTKSLGLFTKLLVWVTVALAVETTILLFK